MTDEPVSLYLLRPLRTEAEAARDIAELDAQANVVDLTQERAFRHVLKIVEAEE